MDFQVISEALEAPQSIGRAFRDQPRPGKRGTDGPTRRPADRYRLKAVAEFRAEQSAENSRNESCMASAALACNSNPSRTDDCLISFGTGYHLE